MDLKDKIMTVFWGRNIKAKVGWEELAESIEEMCIDHFDNHFTWYHNEKEMLAEALEELEIDMMIEKNSIVKFPVPGASYETNVIKRKKRRNCR